VFSENLFEGFAERRPAYGHDGAGSGFAHQRGGFAEEENLNLVTGFRSASPCKKGNAALVGSSEPQALFIMILSIFFFGSSAFAPKDRKGKPNS